MSHYLILPSLSPVKGIGFANMVQLMRGLILCWIVSNSLKLDFFFIEQPYGVLCSIRLLHVFQTSRSS